MPGEMLAVPGCSSVSAISWPSDTQTSSVSLLVSAPLWMLASIAGLQCCMQLSLALLANVLGLH